MTKNKFINNPGSTGSAGSAGSAILKFIIGVGLILGVVTFVLILTTKCECKDKFKSMKSVPTGPLPPEKCGPCCESDCRYLKESEGGGLKDKTVCGTIKSDTKSCGSINACGTYFNPPKYRTGYTFTVLDVPLVGLLPSDANCCSGKGKWSDFGGWAFRCT